MRKADFIFCADMHIRESIPICRVDPFIYSQWGKLDFLSELQKEHECPIGCAGDFLHHWKPSPSLLTTIMEHMPNEFNTIYGDHDLPNHSFKMKNKSGLKTLDKAGVLKIVHGGHGVNKYSKKLPTRKPSFTVKGRKILLWHIMTWKNKLPFPGCEASSGKSLLKRYPEFDVIVTGDNHSPFIVKHEGRLLVNTGSMMRQSAIQIDYKPAFWLYYADTNTVKKVYIPIEPDVITREHLEAIQVKNDRIDAYVGAFQSLKRPSLDFDKNVEKFFAKNKTPITIRNIINDKFENDGKV